MPAEQTHTHAHRQTYCVCMCAFVIHSTLRCIEISFSLSFRSLQSAYRVFTLSLSLSHTHTHRLAVMLRSYALWLSCAFSLSLSCYCCHPLKPTLRRRVAAPLTTQAHTHIHMFVCVCVCVYSYMGQLEVLGEKTGSATCCFANGRK